MDILPPREMARALQHDPMQCPVIGCGAPLTVRNVQAFMVGCGGNPMHLWRKEDLFYLRSHARPEVVEREPVEGAPSAEELVAMFPELGSL